MIKPWHLVPLALFACSSAEHRAESIVSHDLRDPAAAHFRNIVVLRDTNRTVCGEVNAPNAAGGYIGFKRFAVSLRDSGLVLERDDVPIPATHWALLCTGPGAKRDSMVKALPQ